MLLKTKGKPYHIDSAIVTKVTRDPKNSDPNTALIVEDASIPNSLEAFRAILTDRPYVECSNKIPCESSVQTFDHLIDGDIVVINSDGVINTLYRARSHQNFLLFTERCNSNCLMCSQPPRDKDDTFLVDIYKQLIPLIPKDCPEIGITGGEPTLLGDHFFELLELLKKELPETDIHCLSNGRSFAWENM